MGGRVHDEATRRAVKDLKRSGYKVRADIQGYPKPPKIGKYKRIPDIYATKGKKVVMVEVETTSSYDKDRDQRSTFRRSVGQRKNAELRTIVVDRSGRVTKQSTYRTKKKR